ncbi:MAG: metallophosphoesterase family protein [Clostridia bacterium]|nr:metallophosphoesterase family protein [Clostridia bacterium]
MRILHIADLHLGAKNSKLPKDKQDILKNEMMENCHHLFCEVGRRYDAVVVCGDLFHSKNVSVSIAESFFKYVQQYEKPVLYVSGNHDEKFIMPEKPNNFIVLDGQNPSYQLEECVFWAGDNLTGFDENKTNVLLLHGNIENPQDNDYVDINSYLQYNFDYIALGHIHQVKKYKKGAHIFAYSGSLFSNGFDECGDKGYLDVEIENKTLVRCEFRPLEQRRYLICEYDISGDNSNAEIEGGVRAELQKIGATKKDVIRVILKGYYEEHFSKSLTILEEKMENYFYIEFEDSSKIRLDIEKLKSETLSLKNEFISLVEEADLAQEVKEKVIKLGIEALKGEDLSV